jgi:hypothetical protein
MKSVWLTPPHTLWTSTDEAVAATFAKFLDELIGAATSTESAATTYVSTVTDTMAITSSESVRKTWEIIDDTQDANWQNIGNTQTAGWTNITTTP